MTSNTKNTSNRVNNKFNGKNYKSLDQISLIRNQKQSYLMSIESNNLTSSYFKELYLKIFSNNSFIRNNLKLNSHKSQR
jgi:hypothetical protein